MANSYHSFPSIKWMKISRKDDFVYFHDTDGSVWQRHRDGDDLLGQGGEGMVYRHTLQDGDRDRTVRAVKEIRKKSRPHADEDELETMRNEVNKIVQLQKMLNEIERGSSLFVHFYDAFQDEKTFYIAMEYLSCGDLSQYTFSKDRSLSHAVVCHIGYQLLRAIDVLHEHRYAHRDLKPENILVANPQQWSIKLTDFGTAKLWENTLLVTTVGTSYYRAPEVGDDETNSYDMQADIWSAGVIMYELLQNQRASSKILDRNRVDTITWPLIDNPFGPIRQNVFIPMLQSKSSKRPRVATLLDNIHQAGFEQGFEHLVLPKPKKSLRPSYPSPKKVPKFTLPVRAPTSPQSNNTLAQINKTQGVVTDAKSLSQQSKATPDTSMIPERQPLQDSKLSRMQPSGAGSGNAFPMQPPQSVMPRKSWGQISMWINSRHSICLFQGFPGWGGLSVLEATLRQNALLRDASFIKESLPRRSSFIGEYLLHNASFARDTLQKTLPYTIYTICNSLVSQLTQATVGIMGLHGWKYTLQTMDSPILIMIDYFEDVFGSESDVADFLKTFDAYSRRVPFAKLFLYTSKPDSRLHRMWNSISGFRIQLDANSKIPHDDLVSQGLDHGAKTVGT